MPQLIVTAVVVEGRSKSEVARDYGVSRRWVITLVQRFLAEGDTGLQPRSRPPRSSPSRTAVRVEDEIVEIRQGPRQARSRSRRGHHRGALGHPPRPEPG